MAVLFTRGKQTAKRFGLLIFEKSSQILFPFFKSYENNGPYNYC